MVNVKHVLSLGGGVNSTALMVWLIQEQLPLDVVVFADTGGEVPETYQHLALVERYLAEHKVQYLHLPGLVRGRDLYQTCWERKVFPSAVWRWSTRDFKVKPIHRYYRSLNSHINQYLGIAFDELERMSTSREEYITNLYPLVDHRLNRTDCERLIAGAGLPIPVRSSCYFCPFNNADRWRWLLDHHPELFDKAIALEENSKHFPSQRLTDQMFRAKETVWLRNLPERLVSIGTNDGIEELQPCGAECFT